ncbi:hypothetical protein L1D31_22405, partial [Vibrio sp. Isolate23]|nr:hypothetical protein [Vibrio sp. Isolate23]
GAALGALSGGIGAAAGAGASTATKIAVEAIDTVVSAGAEFGINVAMGNSVEKSLQMAAVGAAIGVASTSAGIGVGKIKSTSNKVAPLPVKNILSVQPTDDVLNVAWGKGGNVNAKLSGGKITAGTEMQLQYLPYSPNRIRTLELLNDPKYNYMTTSELSGCGFLINKSKAGTSVAHIDGGKYSNKSMNKIADRTGSTLFNSSNYGDGRAMVAGINDKSGGWQFFAQNRDYAGKLIGHIYPII